MIFKRRDPKPFLRSIAELLWPRGGWARAFHYVKHRMRRLPDSPERIARGIWAGVFVTFSPLFGMHFFIAAFLAKIMKGNILASLMATFVGNPLTFVFIALASLKSGHWILGTELEQGELRSLSRKFSDAGSDLWQNVVSIFTPEKMDWSGLAIFSRDVFYPYLIGGILPGIFFATISYYLAVPVLRAYQKRRRGVIKAKFEALKAKTAAKAEEKKLAAKEKKESANG
ncbi:DUF2062 domain-containing protein [Sulfitobacter donghicola]|uniref:DNA-directed RNA polymerase subunit omega n=1 Tax=Sulfitobacter donghicola DSW-25 = KCTC 12864 = JCM 14565 TaxID=1300350 RepID=A0A073J038_9RHOB|nr:DUF2062 domain-containing protein [Sulfitobacter donghicola]KEJ91002.1 DNA-directed RNA polymerase subunit omega [Sulfitobacter donghicola DSW-25 = KCTC 12864 = JCM 14565]KIN68296.1 hypothetical protein Z948_2025 [Sulfitobacter donghicola DSW-25 = KCTC 12864 = JCM 14565]